MGQLDVFLSSSSISSHGYNVDSSSEQSVTISFVVFSFISLFALIILTAIIVITVLNLNSSNSRLVFVD